MDDERATFGRTRRRAKPLDRIRLNELALAYVARFSTTGGKLKAYLNRKLRERGFVEDEHPDIDGLVEDFVARGFVDDETYGRSKANDLASRGYGSRRIEQTLRAAGIDEGLRQSLSPEEGERRRAAVILARKKKLGPFALPADVSPDEARKLREKRLAAMVRAGHDFEIARRVTEADTVEELEEWVAEAQDERD